MTSVGIVQPIIPSYRQPVFAELARRPGIDLTVYAPLGRSHGSLPGTGAVDDYATVDVSARNAGPFVWDPGSLEAARAGHEVLILSWQPRALFLRRALRTARRLGVGTIIWGHGYSKNDSPMRRRLRLRPARLADACLYYAPATAARAPLDGIEPGRAFSAPNAIDQSAIEAAKSKWAEAPGRLRAFQTSAGIDPERTLIFISRIEEDKRLELLLDAMPHVLEADPRMTLLVVGEGTARASAEAYSDSLGLGDSVRFLGAIYDEEELAGWCLSSICMTYPVAVGLSVMHAFGYGLPVLTSDDLASHNPEINAIRDGVNGMLYREGDVRSLADAIIRLAGDPELRRRMSLAALDSVRGPDGWTVENMVDGFVRCIEAVRSMHQRG